MATRCSGTPGRAAHDERHGGDLGDGEEHGGAHDDGVDRAAVVADTGPSSNPSMSAMATAMMPTSIASASDQRTRDDAGRGDRCRTSTTTTQRGETYSRRRCASTPVRVDTAQDNQQRRRQPPPSSSRHRHPHAPDRKPLRPCRQSRKTIDLIPRPTSTIRFRSRNRHMSTQKPSGFVCSSTTPLRRTSSVRRQSTQSASWLTPDPIDYVSPPPACLCSSQSGIAGLPHGARRSSTPAWPRSTSRLANTKKNVANSTPPAMTAVSRWLMAW